MPHAAPLIAYGVPTLPGRAGRADTFARSELANHLAAACSTVHGHRDPATCAACRRLLEEAS